MTRITKISGQENQQGNPFDALDLTPDTLNTISDTELDELRQAVHEIWRTRESREDDQEAIGASIVINNEYITRKREMPNKDKLDEITEKFEKTAITGEDKKKEEKLKFIQELTEVFEKNLPEYELIIRLKKEVKSNPTAK